MFSCVTTAGEFSIARRGGAWYGEFDGEVFGPFETAADTARYLASGAARRLDDRIVPVRGVPSDLAAWRRGSLERARSRPVSGQAPPGACSTAS
jgi:hypothetical protein